MGMRRPWLVGGAVSGALALLVVATAPNLSVLLLGWCLAQLSYNALLAAITAILPDQVPTEQRGIVSGILGVGPRWEPHSARSWCSSWPATCS